MLCRCRWVAIRSTRRTFAPRVRHAIAAVASQNRHVHATRPQSGSTFQIATIPGRPACGDFFPRVACQARCTLSVVCFMGRGADTRRKCRGPKRARPGATAGAWEPFAGPECEPSAARAGVSSRGRGRDLPAPLPQTGSRSSATGQRGGRFSPGDPWRPRLALSVLSPKVGGFV